MYSSTSVLPGAASAAIARSVSFIPSSGTYMLRPSAMKQVLRSL